MELAAVPPSAVDFVLSCKLNCVCPALLLFLAFDLAPEADVSYNVAYEHVAVVTLRANE